MILFVADGSLIMLPPPATQSKAFILSQHPTTREEENRRGEQTDGILDMNNHSFSLNCQGVLTCLGQEDEPITYSGPSDFDSGKAGSRPWFNRVIVVVWTWPE